MPTKPGSEIGVSMTRSVPNSSTRPQHLEGRAGLGHVLAEDEDRLVAPHLLGERLVHGLGQGDFSHRVSPQSA
jgi:hypothetical protein